MMANRDALNGGGDAVVALRLKRTAGVDAGTPPSGTAKTEPPPNVLPAQSGPISIWRPPDKIEEFRLIQPVGRGGMGEVFLAYDEILERHVAVKIIGGIDPDPASRERFMLEARAAARLQHPNVLTVYRVGEVEGRPYLATEFIHGTGLDEIDKPLSSRQVLQLGVGLARGLAAAHRRGVLHRDIKPGNAILPHDGEVKLLDFGLAKLLDPTAPFPGWRPTLPPGPVPPQPVVTAPVSRTGGTLVSIRAEAPTEPPASDGRTSLTDAGALMGTPDYMAPEIWRGEPATRRSDVYALGALLFELCAGRPPHRDVPARSLAQHVTKHDAPPLASVQLKVDPKLAEVIDRCLCRDPARRYASGDDLREALEQLELSSRVGVIPQGNPYRGLHTFEAEHRALFFGRRTEIGVFLERLRNETIVMVAGDSGVGKSSLCRAGILPAVQEGALGSGRVWSVLRMVPGRWPLLSLGAALAPLLAMDEGAVVRRLRAHPSAIARTLRGRLGDKTGVLLFIDQLEELVTVGEAIGAGIVAEVLGHLAQGLPGVRLLVTVRSDFLAQVASLPRLGDEIARSLVFLKALSPDGIREAITGPARITNVTFESEVLVETLVSSTSAADGGLPLLQFALAELWEARDQARGAITAEALDKIGGVAGALARHADEVVLGMTTVQRSAARRILFMLVSPQGTPVRRREDEIVAGDPEARAALHSLVRGRLLVVRDAEQGPTYELAHEALRRGWDTLRRWLDELAGSRAVRQRLAAAAMEWERLDRSRDVLWNVRQLNELGIVEPDDLLPREVAFAEASRAALRRTKRSRVALMAAFPFMVGAAYAALRLHARSELQQRVDAHVVEAERYIEAARLDEDASRAARREAFADFDNLHRHQGEVSWERARILAGKADVAYGHASQALETALMLGAGGHDIMGRLGDVLVARAELAERHHQLEQRDELLQRLALYDLGGLRRSRWAAPAEVSIHSTPAGAHVAIGRYMDDAQRRRRLVPLQRIDAGPASGVVLAPGSYLFSFELPGYAPARYPIVLERAERLVLTVPLLRAERVPDGFVYVAPGRFLFGSAADEEARRAFFNTAPLHETHTGAFLVARDETTWADWLHFLDALPPGERLLRTPRVAGLTGALELKELGAGAWTLTLQPSRRAYTAPMGEPIRYDARERRIVHDWLHLPVSGISLDDAQAYAAWLARTGRVPGARLCTEREWERAARGADGREFPNGDALEADDANIDETYGKDPLAFGPDEVGSHPTSQSPFGVNDTCGNVFEWTLSSLVPDEHALRGGAYYYDRTTARSANRQVSEPGIRDANVGIRICVTLE